jgi:signal peptidase I
MPLGGLKWEDEEDSSKNYENRGSHVKVYHYVKHKHRHFKKLKKKHLPGIAGEIFDFAFAFIIAWLFIQFLGIVLGTGAPLVVVESESMVHEGVAWEEWHYQNNLNPDSYPFAGGMNIGDIILVKGDDPKDIVVGDIIIYTKYDNMQIGGEPIIHRVVGVVEFKGGKVSETTGAVSYEEPLIKVPCTSEAGYTPREIGDIYTTTAIQKLYPDLKLQNFRLFITKGDNNAQTDQCPAGVISFPVHEDLVQGRAKFDIPYLGYVKLGLVCAFNGIRGDMCDCRCWWPASSPKCCAKNGI